MNKLRDNDVLDYLSFYCLLHLNFYHYLQRMIIIIIINLSFTETIILLTIHNNQKEYHIIIKL